MLRSPAVGSRVLSASRRRLYRRRAAVAWAFIAILLVGGLRPTDAEASWVALLTKAIAQVREGVDLWEKHTRQLEDWMDKASGMMQPFSELHAGYRELTDLSGIKRLARTGQVYRANVQNPECFMPGSLGSCPAVGDFMPSSLRRMQSDAHRILGASSNIADGYSWGELEAVIRRTGGTRDGGSGQWIADDRPAWVTDAMAGWDDLDYSLNRVKHHKIRMFRNTRRATGIAERYQRLGGDVLRVSAAAGIGSAVFFAAGGGGDFDRDADGGVECRAGTGQSLVTGANARLHGSTLLAQVMEMDCAGGADAGGNPLDPLTPGAHVSPNEVLGVQAALGIWEANQAATQLEDMALQMSRLVQSRQIEAESARRRVLRLRDRLECPEAPALVDCADFNAGTPADFEAAEQEIDREVRAALPAAAADYLP